MKKLLVYLKDYKKESFLAPLFKMLEASFELFVPYVVASIIDRGIKLQSTSYIVKMCLVLLLLAAIGMVSAISAQYFAAKAAVGFSAKLRHAFFEKVQSLSFSELDSIGTSRLITMMTSDINTLQNGVNLVLRLFLRSPFIVFGAMIMAFTIDFKSALIFVAVIPALSIVVFGIMALTVPMFKKVMARLDSITKITRENLNGARVIRAFTNEDSEQAEFMRENASLAALQKATGRISALLNPLTFAMINIAIIVLIRAGALKVNSGELTQGQVVALYNYMSQILVELIKLANLIVLITKSFASANRVSSLLETESSLEYNSDKSIISDCAVEFSNVSFKFKGASDYSLKNINFRARKGQTIGIIGSTGSGKTSLVSLIPHFYDADSGVVSFNGRDVKSYSDKELRKQIGFVMQNPALFRGTVRKNLLWGAENASDEQLESALEKAQIAQTIREKGGLDFMIEQGGRNLSGGQKQRLAVARALAGRPCVLIFDDSASALDYATEKRLRNEILNLSYKPTVFIVSQRASSIMHADKIIVLDEGTAVAEGTHSQLLSNCEVYREIYNTQFKPADGEVTANG